MILREMPVLSSEQFRTWFYARWGKENCVITGRTRNAEYPAYQQRLSVKAAWGGQENYFVDGRRLAIDDETFMILNDGRTYSSSLRSGTPVTSFAIFFRPGIAEEVARAATSSQEVLLDSPAEGGVGSIEFAEHIRRHDRQITPILRFIYRHVQMGITDEDWYEEQFYFLVRRMLALRDRDHRASARIQAIRPSTRKELLRRIGMGVDFINTHFAEPIGLSEIAAASRLASYHCLRTFQAAYGMTPTDYLHHRRTETAERLLRDTQSSFEDVAALVGYSRTTLYRRLKHRHGVRPNVFRRTLRP